MLRTWLLRLATLIALGGTAVGAWSQAPGKGMAEAPATQRRVVELMAMAGVHKALEASAQAYERQLKEGVPEHLLKENGGALDKAVRESLSPVRMGYFISQAVSRAVSPAEVATLMRWYTSDLGRRVVDLQVGGLDLMRAEEKLIQLGLDEAARQSKERNALIAELVSVSREGDLMAAMAVRIGSASVARMEAAPGMTKEMLAFFLKRIEDQRPALKAHFDSISRARNLVTLKGLKDSEIRELIRFEETIEERKFVDAVVKGTETAVIDALERIVEAGQRGTGRTKPLGT